ncbi:GerAB/ArcD/ProY family transporter [Bacillus sp. REN16]|uniref:GerAB/ArcD/ProY family transporter n=1 Tax=Bacillus sp. REN16 TaxID=2887296 RepID=UPI001E332FE0|nr:endospore germination permease [Bacillus sp. REN16]MCC3357013.1 spore germination protein [Bacillus sp. REN16]
MIQAKGKEISFVQFILLIHGVQMGVGVLTLPRDLAEKAGTDGWISLIIGWFISVTSSLIIIQIMKRHPNGTILDLLTFYFGKWIGKIGGFIFVLYFSILAFVTFTREAVFIQAWILPRTKLYMLILLLAIPTYLLARNNVQILGRYSVVVFFMTLWTIILYLIPLKDARWLYLLPILKEGWYPVISAVKTTIFTFVGFEIAFFLYPFLQNKKSASIGVIIANTISMFAFLIITIVSFAFFSPDEITQYNEPTITILKVIEFSFIERLEVVLFAFYLFVMSSTVVPLIFMSVVSTSWLLGKEDHTKPLCWFLVFMVIYVFCFPPSLNIDVEWQKGVQYLGLIFAYAIPIGLWAFVLIHGLFKRRATS